MKWSRLALLTLSLALCAAPVLAQDQPEPGPSSQPAKAISDWTEVGGGLVIVPGLLSHNPDQRETSWHAVDAVLITYGLTEGLKDTIHSPRPAPFQSDRRGFPSGHASYAFAIAASLSAREPRDACWAYPLAAAVGWSRVQLNRHTWAQVLGGAALGTFVGMQTGSGRWHLFGHRNHSRSRGEDLQAAAADLLDGEVTVWSTTF